MTIQEFKVIAKGYSERTNTKGTLIKIYRYNEFQLKIRKTITGEAYYPSISKKEVDASTFLSQFEDRYGF